MNNKREKQKSVALKPLVVNGIFLIGGAVIGGLLTYFGSRATADAQIKAAQANAQAQMTSAWEGAQAQITSAWMQVYGPIQATQTAEENLTQVALSATPYSSSIGTSVITPTPYSDAIIAVDNFYGWINNAGNKDDLNKSWDLETSGSDGLQCKEAAGCSFSSFKDFWWTYNIHYKLYDCGSNVVDVVLSYYLRDVKLATTPSAPEYWRYQLVDIQGQLKLNRVDPIEGPGAGCVLTIGPG